jgi:hypothetical protein
MICLTPPMPDLEQSGIDPDETLPSCDEFPLLGPSSLDGPGTGTKDDGKDSQWGPADEQTDDDNSTKQADPTDFRVPGQDADKSVLGREAPPGAQVSYMSYSVGLSCDSITAITD